MQTTVPNLNEIKSKFLEWLAQSGWNGLRGFINSGEFDSIINKLYELKQSGVRFTPPIKNVFKTFQDCKYNNLKVVVLGQDPYPQFGIANGVAFCCENSTYAQPSLKYILKSIYSTVYPDLTIPDKLPTSLSYLSEQGVLLLNTALTCEIGKPASHYEIWKHFIAYAIDMLNNIDKSLVFILLGKRAQEYEDLIDDKHYIIKASHPASAAYANDFKWDCNDCFNKCNQILENSNIQKIKWLNL